MQIEELIAEDMRKRDERYIQNHPYAITQNKRDGRWVTSVYESSGKRRTIASSSLEQLNKKIIEHYKKLEKEQSVTFPIICKEWLDEKLRHKEITFTSHTKYMTDYKRYFLRDHEFNRLPVSDITDSDLRWFIKDTITDLNLTKKVYKQMQILLKGALLYAKEEGYTEFSAGTFFFDLVLSDRLFARKKKMDDATQVFDDIEVQMIVNHLEEVVSDVFLSLWNHPGDPDRGSLKGYLAAITRNKARDRLRRFHIEVPLESDCLEVPVEDSCRQIELAQLKEAVKQVVDRLEEPDRTILLRNYYFSKEPGAISNRTMRREMSYSGCPSSR